VDLDPALKTNSKFQKNRLLAHLRKIEKEARAIRPVPALNVLKQIQDTREKVRNMDQSLRNQQTIKELSAIRNKQPRPFMPQPLRPQAGGSISGKVTDAKTSLPIEYTEISIYDTDGNFVNYGYTDSTGSYTLETGTGTFFAVTYSQDDHIDEVYNDIECEPYCDVTAIGTQIIVTGQVTGIDFALSPGGHIAGNVKDAANNEPLPNISVIVYDSDRDVRAYGYSDLSGNFVTTGALTTGNYFAATYDSSSSYLGELYQELPCQDDCNILAGTPIAVTSGSTTWDINFTLDKSGIITGNVVESENSKYLYAAVEIYDSNGNYVSSGYTDSFGNYQVGGLVTQNYFAVSYNYYGYLDELFDNIPCYNHYCEPRAGIPIAVTKGETTNGIDFSLQRGGEIRGYVRKEESDNPIPCTGVDIFDSSGNSVGYGYTDQSGHYSVAGLAKGNYYARTLSYYGEYVDELYDNHPCGGGNCDVLSGTPIFVGYDGPVKVNFGLQKGGKIAGKLKDSTTGEPIEYGYVNIFDSDGNYAAYGYTDENGKYVTAGLATGDYFAVTSSYGDYVDEVYKDHHCNISGCDILSGDPISVTVSQTTSGIDFALDKGGSISGTVTSSATASPISDFYTLIFDAQGGLAGYGYSDWTTGNYHAGGLYSGNYYVVTENFENYVDELYDDIPCNAALCNPLVGKPVSVTTGKDTSGIDFALDAGGTISGKVVDAQTFLPLPNVYLGFFDQSGNGVSYGYTDENGNYHSQGPGLSTGSYFVETESYDYVNEIYDNIPCEFCDPLTGTPITVTTGSNTGNINFDLDHGGSISGVIKDEATGLPIDSAHFEIYDAAGNFINYGYTDEDGKYTAGNLMAGNYFIVASSYYQNYISEIYDNIVCPAGSCDPLSGTSIPVTNGNDTSGIDFDLALCSVTTFSPMLMPEGEIGTSYNQTISITGGTAPYHVEIESGNLPLGLTFDEDTGVISGTPLAIGFFGFTMEATDVNGCSSYWNYSITINYNGGQQYSDDFEDGRLSTTWDYKGQWNEIGGKLTASTNTKAKAFASNAFGGCLMCSLHTSVQTSGGKISILTSYVDSKNYVELIMKEQENRWILKQRVNGKVVAKQKAASDIQPNVDYDVVISFDGNNFSVNVNNVGMISLPMGAMPQPGIFGFQVSKSTAGFDFVSVQ
jgi:hypothetical protein